MLFLAACLAGMTGARVGMLLGEMPAVPTGSRRAALVERVTEKRYYREVLALISEPERRDRRRFATGHR